MLFYQSAAEICTRNAPCSIAMYSVTILKKILIIINDIYIYIIKNFNNKMYNIIQDNERFLIYNFTINSTRPELMSGIVAPV